MTKSCKTFESVDLFKEYFKENHPSKHNLIKSFIQEISTLGAAGGFLTKYAFQKPGTSPNISQYTSIGYKLVNPKSLRKKAKGIDYVDLHK